MTIQTAVILAAGMGTRLKEKGTSMPKGFLQLGKSLSIIEESIKRLKIAGIQQIIIITGHCSHAYDQLQALDRSHITTVHNPKYVCSGSLYSLCCAQSLIDRDFLLLESDLIYEQAALSTLLAYPQDDVILLSGFTGAGDEVYVQGNNGKIQAISKRRVQLNEQVVGELVGISRVSYSLFQRLVQYGNEQFRSSLNVDYETDGLVAISQSHPIYYTVINDLLWAEIDDDHHLMRATQEIYPAILRKELRPVCERG